VRGNQLIFSRSGDRRKLFAVSPYLFSQYELINGYFLPEDKELPLHGLQGQVLVFDFGFALAANTVAPMDTQFFPITLPNNFLATGVTGVSDIPPSTLVNVAAAGATSGVQQDPSYLLNFQQTHGGNTWQFMNKDVSNGEGVGTGEHPMMFKSPVFLPAGDTISCVVRNLMNASLRVQVTLIGGSF
jgi:hypothetical protein